MAKFCGSCGSKLENDKCPKCDAKKVEVEVVSTSETKTNALAITGFVFSLVSIIFGICAIPGLVCSIVGLSQTKRTKEDGKGLAVAGIIVSAVTLAIYVIAIFLVFIFAMAVSGY